MAKMLRIETVDRCWIHFHPVIAAKSKECSHCSAYLDSGVLIPKDCPLPDAEPAPYSAENPPKEGDMVRTRDGNSGMICSIRIVQEMGGTKIAFVRVVFPVLPARSSPVFDCYAITEVSLLYRPPSGDQP